MNSSTSLPAPFFQFLGVLEAQIINPIITLLTLAAFILFIWGVVEYVRNADNPEKRKTGTQHIIWGLIGLVIIFGAQAIVKVLQGIATTFQQ